MVRLREIPRTAAFAWSTGPTAPWIVTGTKSGAVDTDFSNETCLELWDLGLDRLQSGQELQPAVTLPTEAGFHDLAWTPPTDSRKRGVIAGAFDNGSLGLWDAELLQTDVSAAAVSNEKIHSGAIKALQFNPKIPNFLATGGANGELFISDLNHLESPIRLGSTAARADDIDCLDWNKKVANILVTGSSGGFVTVWDMKTKKESLTMNNHGRKPCSAIAWDPEKPTRLITAVPLEQDPVILVWDLRNSNAPEKILKGHDSGVLSLSWCTQDSDLLLSCGKDNRTILWNPQTGEPYGDYPVVTNWTFQTRWNPYNPSMFATASFDGKLQVQTTQNTNPTAVSISEQNQAADGEDFFSKAQTQPQTSSFSLQKAPKYLERPVSVSFGFGGRLIIVKPDATNARSSKVEITKFEVDSSVGSATETFEKALQSGNLTDLCQQRVFEAKSEEEKADWKVMETLVSASPRKQIVKYLGFENEEDEVTNGVASVDLNKSPVDSAPTSAVSRKQSQHKRFQSIFESTPDGDFLSELAATKGTKTNQPFQIFTGSESEADRKITRALMLGNFDKALDICLEEDRMSDAFMIAICGGEECTKKAQEAYFAKQSGGPPFLRLLASVVGKNLWDTVHNADLANWKEIMATMCTFADENEFPDLCEALGDRLEEQGLQARKDASFCYMAGSKLEKVVAIWVQELKEHEESAASEEETSDAFHLHARGLQDLIEKVTIFRRVVNFRDTQLDQASDWKLDPLYSKYLEYADIVASHGQLAVAQRYLDLLPTQYPEADVARSRIEKATKKPSTQQTTQTRAAAATTTTTTRQQRPLPGQAAYQAPGFQPAQNTFTPAATSNPYSAAVPPAPTPFASAVSNPYAPAGAAQLSQPTNPYAPAGGYQPPQQMRPGPPQQGFGVPPPPRAYNQSPAVVPPSQDKNMSAWNDIPEGFGRAPTPRRSGTPSAQPTANVTQIPSQAPLGAQSIAPPPTAPYGARRASPLPPPPKGPAAPPQRVTSPLAGQPQQTGSRPGSGTTNPYAPPSSSMDSANLGYANIPPPIPRGPSPYNAPPSGAPPPNRYAPAPGSQSSAPPSRPQVAPPPQGGSFQAPPPISNPYAPRAPLPSSAAPPPFASSQQFQQQAPSIVPPPPSQQFTSAPPPMNGATQQQAGSRSETAAPPPQAQPAVRKHPKGDRTHIPANAEPIYTILSSEMTRVKARAPASFKPQVLDTEKRLDILFDHLNNEDLLRPDTIAQLVNLSQALQNRDFNAASDMQMEIHRDKVEECGNWMVGVKRLIGMCRATP